MNNLEGSLGGGGGQTKMAQPADCMALEATLGIRVQSLHEMIPQRTVVADLICSEDELTIHQRDPLWPYPHPLARATLKSQNVTETTRAVALTRGRIYKRAKYCHQMIP